MRNKLAVGQRVQLKVWHEAANHWEWPWEETLTGTVVALPEGTYKNNWNYNPRDFALRTDDGKVVQIENATKIEILPPSSKG
jgi:hypothetical protein